jgi:hypothetical protein
MTAQPIVSTRVPASWWPGALVVNLKAKGLAKALTAADSTGLRPTMGYRGFCGFAGSGATAGVAGNIEALSECSLGVPGRP